MIKSFLGASGRYLLNRLNSPSIILLYHRVTHLENDPQLLSVTPDRFYDQIDLLRKNFNLLGIEEFYELFAHRKKIPRNAAIITFDDGYADNYYEALPVLRSLNSQALFYITTSNLDTDRELWWDELERIILGGHNLPAFIEINTGDRLIRFSTSNSAERANTYHALHPHLKYLPPQQRDKIMDALRQSARLSNHGRESHRLLTLKELKQLSDSPSAIIGAHTHNHPALSTLSYHEQLQEMKLSKDILERAINRKISHFSYPYGTKKDYTNDTVHACREIGFNMVCSNYYGQVHSWTDIMRLPRILVRNWDQPTFKKYLSKFFKY